MKLVAYFIVFCSISTVLYSIGLLVIYRRGLRINHNHATVDAHRPVFSTDIADILNARIHRLRWVCSNSHPKDHYKIQYNQTRADCLQSKTLDMSICKVPKAGCTFWSLIVLVIERNKTAQEIFSFPREKIHAMTQRVTKRLINNHGPLTTARNIVVSRNPYSRLFSAFVDKYFQLAFSGLSERHAHSLRRGYYITDAGKCGYNLTFQDFLEQVTSEGLQGKGIDQHWSPVYAMCNVCDVDYQYVIQQETMTRDTRHILRELNTKGDTFTALTQMFRESGASKMMEGVLQSAWDKFTNNESLRHSCENVLAYCMKLWDGFKIQGYIRTDDTFPLSGYHGNETEHFNEFTNVVLSTITNAPLSNIERKTQRRLALINAYDGLPNDLIARIQEMYMMDFYIFDYDLHPPK